MKLSDWFPIILSLIAFLTAATTATVNFFHASRLNRQKMELEATLRTLTSRVDLLSREQSTAAAGQRMQLNHEIESLHHAISAAQDVKDALEGIATAARHPNTIQRVAAIGAFSSARVELQTSHSELVQWLQSERLELHKSKNTLHGLASRFQKEIKGDKTISGASDEILADIAKAVDELRSAQNDLREAASMRQSMLNEGLID